MNKPERLAQQLTADIASGKYGVGQQLPTQSALCKEHGLSRATVHLALRLLADQGLVRGRQGSPAVVTATPGTSRSSDGSWPPREGDGRGSAADDREGQQPGIGDLRLSLREAFDADEITMDVLSLTSETMATSVGNPVTLISRREIKPRSISLRLMLPDITGIQLAFPRALVPPDQRGATEDWSRRRHRDMVIRYAETLSHSLLSLGQRGYVENVSVQIRTVPFTPPLKLYLLNGHELLEGYYTLTTWQPEPPRGESRLTILDSDSFSADATLFRYTTPHQRVKVDKAQKFFDSYWDNLAQELDITVL